MQTQLGRAAQPEGVTDSELSMDGDQGRHSCWVETEPRWTPQRSRWASQVDGEGPAWRHTRGSGWKTGRDGNSSTAMRFGEVTQG